VTVRTTPVHGITDTAPAAVWEDAFPVGNGRHGALVHGGLREESVVVTHHHLVQPGRPYRVPDLAGRLDRVRDLLLAGESASALALFTDGWPDQPPRAFHPAFAVRLTEPLAPATATVPDGYRRSLNYRTGIAVTSWPGRERSCFVSRTRDMVVQRVAATDGAALELDVRVDVALPGAPPGLRTSSQVHQRAAGDVLIVTRVEYPEPGSGGYAGVTRVVAGPGGDVLGTAAGVRVSGAREVTLLTRVAPFRDAVAGVNSVVAGVNSAVAGLPADWGQLCTEHARRHAAAYRDVRLDLGAPAADRALPVGELLARQAAQLDRPLPTLL
jgi:alpha-L-fucosidase 2